MKRLHARGHQNQGTCKSGSVQAPGELRALAFAQASERLAGRDPAAVQDLGGLHAAMPGEGQQHVEDLRGLQKRRRVEQQRTDRRSAGLEVALELRAKRTNLVGPAERVDALIQAAPRCRPMLERVWAGHDIRTEINARGAPRRPGRPRRWRVAQAGRRCGSSRLQANPLPSRPPSRPPASRIPHRLGNAPTRHRPLSCGELLRRSPPLLAPRLRPEARSPSHAPRPGSLPTSLIQQTYQNWLKLSISDVRPPPCRALTRRSRLRPTSLETLTGDRHPSRSSAADRPRAYQPGGESGLAKTGNRVARRGARCSDRPGRRVANDDVQLEPRSPTDAVGNPNLDGDQTWMETLRVSQLPW